MDTPGEFRAFYTIRVRLQNATVLRTGDMGLALARETNYNGPALEIGLLETKREPDRL
jgi:hypothetical protein